MKVLSRKFFKSDKFLICVWAVFLTVLVGVILIWLQNIYLDTHPYFYDPVSALLRNISLHIQTMEEGRLSVALREWLENKRMPFRTLPIILLAPNLLGNKLGHLATSLPALLSFLIVLGLTVKKRSGSTLYAIACCLLFCAIPGLSDLKYGLGVYWFDLVAALFAGSAALCLLNSSEAKDANWLVAFSLFTAFAGLSRYIAFFYIFITCAPVALMFLIRQFRANPSIKKSLLRPIAFALIPVFLVAGYYIISGLPFNYYYYTMGGWDVASPPLEALAALLKFLGGSFFGWTFTSFLVVLFVGNLLISRTQIRDCFLELSISVWYVLVVPLFLMILGATIAVHATMYAVPLWFAVAVSPITFNNQVVSAVWNQRVLKFLSVLILMASSLILVTVVQQKYIQALNPSPQDKAIKYLDVEVSEILANEQKQQGALVWLSFFDVRSPMPVVEAYFRFEQFIRPSRVAPPSRRVEQLNSNEPAFAHRAQNWDARYPDIPPEELKEQVYQDTVNTINVAIIYEDPEMINDINWLNFDPRTAIVAKYMAQNISEDIRWERFASIDTERYGRLIFYRNLSLLNN
jgi:hypothetical protein